MQVTGLGVLVVVARYFSTGGSGTLTLDYEFSKQFYLQRSIYSGTSLEFISSSTVVLRTTVNSNVECEYFCALVAVECLTPFMKLRTGRVEKQSYGVSSTPVPGTLLLPGLYHPVGTDA